MLEALGVDAEAESVYGILLSAPSCQDDLSRASGLSPARLRPVLRRLQSVGLVNRQSTRPPTYAAIDPEVALDGLLLNKQEQLRQARVRAAEFTERFRRAAANRDPAEVVEIVSGPEAIRQRHEQAMAGAVEQLRGFDKPPYRVDPLAQLNKAELDLLARGGIVRAIYETAAIDIPGRVQVLQLWADAGEESRVLPLLPTKMAIVDERIALLPLRPGTGPDPSPSIVVLHRSAVLEALSALFEALWATALPLQLGDSNRSADELPSQEALLLNLLVAGLPDEAIARQLGVSYRTMQRRLRDLMQRANAGTRLQLGVQAVERGWVRREDRRG